MISKKSSMEEKVKLPPTETISRSYHPQKNRKAIRILTVAVYVLCVSLAAIILSLYYIFIWDPQTMSNALKSTNCDKIIIPEQIAIKLINSTEIISADQFFKNILQYHKNSHRRYFKLNRIKYFNAARKLFHNDNNQQNEFVHSKSITDRNKFINNNRNNNNNNSSSNNNDSSYPSTTTTNSPIDDEDYENFVESSGYYKN